MRRVLLALLLLVLLLPVAVVVGAGPLLDSAAVRAPVIAAIERATGRGVRIDGPIGVAWSLAPAVEARQVVVLNGPGFSRAEFATVGRIEARLALLPLLSGRVEVRSVVLERPDVLLERDGAGRGNWVVAPAPAPSGAPGPARPQGARTAVEVGRVSIEQGRVAMLGGPAVSVFSLSASPAGGPVVGQVVVNGIGLTVKGTTGPGAGAVDVSAEGAGVSIAVSGQVAGALQVRAAVADLAGLSLLAGRALPSVRDVAVSGQVGPGGLSAMRLTAGAFEVAPGVTLTRLVAEAAGMDQPLKVTAEGAVRALPVSVAVTAGSLAAVMAGGPVPVLVLVAADGATLSGSGSVADLAGRGLEMTVSARVPDVRRTGGLAGVSLPPVRDAALEVRLAPAPGGAGVLARGLRLLMAQGDVAGDLAIVAGPRASVRGSLVSQRLDLDGLAMPPSAAAAPAAAAPPSASAGPAPGPGRLIPDRAVPLAGLRQGDADLRLSVAQMVLGGAEYRAVETRVLLQDGRLRVDPMQAVGPGGAVQGQVSADASAVPPTASVTLRGAGLEAAPIAAALGAAGLATGTVDLDVQLRATGADIRAMAATLEGRLGLAVVDGEVENAALAAVFGPASRAVGLPAEAGGRSHVRCLAARFDVAGGQAGLKALALDTTRIRLDGEGTINLVDETMDLRLRPTIRIGGTGVQTPVRLAGPIRAPRPALERNPLGRFGLSIGAGGGDPCGAALVAARDGRAGAMPQ